MSGFADVLNELFPTDWLDPYGSMPLNKQYSVQIDITQVETDDGIKVTAVKTPPSASTHSVQDAINMALGMGCCGSKEDAESRQSDKTPEDKQDSGKEDKPISKESENDNESFGSDNKQYSSGRQSSETDRSGSPR